MRSAQRLVVGPAVACSGVALSEYKRRSSRLYTSFYPGQRFPNQMVVPKVRLPASVSASAARTATSNEATVSRPAAKNSASGDEPEGVSWDTVAETDVMNARTAAPPAKTSATSQRSYLPLGEVAKLELQADYFMEGGFYQEALEFYGVVATAYELAYPAGHSQITGILIKVAAALRHTGRGQSSQQTLERALAMLDAASAPSLELVVEAVFELGLTLEAVGDVAAAGQAYEEAVNVVDKFHNFGQSHRMLRLLPRLCRRFNLNHEEKFLYYSPFDYDRVFALADQSLHRAEQLYRQAGDGEGVVRVLQLRQELLDKKFFNMQDHAGRIRTMRGHWMRQARHTTNAPTPDDLLRYSPTLHQPYRDFKYELNTPIGRESEVQPGVNRTVLDMGNHYRKHGERAKRMMRDADYNFERYIKGAEFH